MTTVCYKWGNCDVLWKNANWKWSECLLVQEIIECGVDASTLSPELLPDWVKREEEYLSPQEREKKKRFIILLAKVKGYNETEKWTEVRDDIRITIDDVKLVVKAVAGVDLKIEKESVNYGLLPIHRQK